MPGLISAAHPLKFFQVDVFTRNPFGGNPLVVFPWARDLSTDQMQTVAKEINFSETTFVTHVSRDAYSVRIFTPGSELPFAGHPTIGTAWVLAELGEVTSDQPVQRSPAGETNLLRKDDVISFKRAGSSGPDAENAEAARIAAAVGVDVEDLGIADEGGHRLRPARADAGLPCVVVPVRDLSALSKAHPTNALAEDFSEPGAYVFTFAGEDVHARGFLPVTGVPEDPATGSFAAALGVYLRDRIGEARFRVRQGVDMGRPSEIDLVVGAVDVEVGGTSALVAEGSLCSFPPPR